MQQESFDDRVRECFEQLAEHFDAPVSAPASDLVLVAVRVDNGYRHKANLIRVHLERFGFTVLVTDSGTQALQWLTERPVGLVITDVQLGDSPMLIRTIRQNPTLTGTRLLALWGIPNSLRKGAVGGFAPRSYFPAVDLCLSCAFHPSELVATTCFLLGRAPQRPQQPHRSWYRSWWRRVWDW